MGVDLEKELREEYQKRVDLHKNSPLEDVKQLLLEASNEDVRILRGMGQNSTFMQMEGLIGKSMELENLEKEYGHVYEEQQIKDLAVRYRLRFLKSSYFIGKMDREVTAKIKEFSKTYKIDLNEANLSYNFYILAEPGAFQLERIRVERFENLKNSLANEFLDPVLFYKIKPGIFIKVHKWGNDFTIWRRLLGYKWQNENTVRTFNFFTHIGILSLVTAFLLPTAIITSPIFTLSMITLISGIGAWIRNLAIIKNGGFFNTDTTEYLNDYFTPYNWNSTEELA